VETTNEYRYLAATVPNEINCNNDGYKILSHNMIHF
jgi:hypothetical protein